MQHHLMRLLNMIRMPRIHHQRQVTQRFAFPPPFPSSPTTFPPAFFIAFAARKQFTEFPLVVNITSTSPFFANASTCLKNT